MTWGIPTDLFLKIHVAPSLIGIASGLSALRPGDGARVTLTKVDSEREVTATARQIHSGTEQTAAGLS
jgi:hypothetical protein